MKKQNTTVLIVSICIIILLITTGILLFQRANYRLIMHSKDADTAKQSTSSAENIIAEDITSSVSSMQKTSTSINFTSTSSQIRSEKTADDLQLETTIKQQTPIIEKNDEIAQKFTFTSIPSNFVEYCDQELKFCFSYPKEWGTFLINKTNTFCSGENQYDITGEFTSSKTFVAAIFPDTSQGEKCIFIGNDFDATNAYKSSKDADTVIQIAPDQDLAIWYSVESEMFYTFKSKMIFTAPTNHPLYSRIAFNGPAMNDAQTTKNDIHDFLNVAYSFRLL